jgi:uncharacterized repeat protein (TIGR03803 family)
MAKRARLFPPILPNRFSWGALAALSVVAILLLPSAQAQTFTVLHAFSGGGDGANPDSGVTLDNADNIYGTTFEGGFTHGSCSSGCGTVFKLTQSDGHPVLHTIYAFQGPSQDGSEPGASMVFGPDGALYGTTVSGGMGDIGTVYRLAPQPSLCRNISCSWIESHYSFPRGDMDGGPPSPGALIFDSLGNMYGTASFGGAGDCGLVYEMSLRGGTWTQTALYNFEEPTSCEPFGGVIFDASGNLYGTTTRGGPADRGTIYQLTPHGITWSETVLYDFTGHEDGGYPQAGLISDGNGGFYGAASQSTPGGGTIFHLAQSGGAWNFNVIFSLPGNGTGVLRDLTMDAAGNLYGATYTGGAFGRGSIIKLAPSNGGWTYTDLQDFDGGFDGAEPACNIAIDASGRLYGTAFYGAAGGNNCPEEGCGVVWRITP